MSSPEESPIGSLNSSTESLCEYNASVDADSWPGSHYCRWQREQSLSGHNTREEVDDSTVLKTRIELKQVYYNL